MGQGYAVSDSLYKNGGGMAAWIIEGQTSTNRVTGACYTPGQMEDHSSFRSELASLLSLLYTLSFWKPPTGIPTCCIACDGQSVINQLSSPQPIELTEPHFDLLQAVRTLLNTCGFIIKLVFVCGHQDTGVPTVLMRDAYLNIEADTLAKCKIVEEYAGPHHYCLPGYKWACYTAQGRVVKQFDASLHLQINGPQIKEYWKVKARLTNTAFEAIDWSSFRHALRELPQSRQHWVTKMVSSHFGHGKNMVRWQQWASSNCP